MRPGDSAYDRTTGNFGWSVDYVEDHGWRVLGPDANDVTVIAEPGTYYDTQEQAEEAMRNLQSGE